MQPVSTRRISPEYQHILAEAIRRAEARGIKVAEESGLGRTGVWRFKREDGNDPPSVAAAERLTAYLSTVENVLLPPPTIRIVDVDHYEWAALGEWMLRHAPDDFATLLDRVRKIVEGRRAAADLAGSKPER